VESRGTKVFGTQKGGSNFVQSKAGESQRLCDGFEVVIFYKESNSVRHGPFLIAILACSSSGKRHDVQACGFENSI
jgi:hypothetical protein